MASDDMKKKLMQTTSRQKFIIITFVVVVLIIIWQIMGLFGGGSSPTPQEIKPVAKMNAEDPNKKISSNDTKATPAPTTANSTAPVANTMQSETGLSQGSIVNDPQFVRMQRLTEEKYMGKLNELEELRVQRQIAETNQAIAAAKLATVTAEKDISDLLTRPALGNGSQTVRTSVDVSPPTMTESSTGIPIPQPQQPVIPYTLVSVSMLLNKWSAIVSYQGTMYTVGVGDILPPDGSVVTNIGKNSITIRKDGKSRKIGITSSV